MDGKAIGFGLSDTAALTPSPGVLASSQGDTVVLMSLRSGRYHTLDETGTRVWRALEDGARLGDVVATVMEELQLHDEEMAAALRAFAGDLVRRRFVDVNVNAIGRGRPVATAGTAVTAVPAASPRALPSTIACAAILALISVGLRLFGLARVWRLAHRKTAGAARLLPDYVSALHHRVLQAASLCPLRAQCLEQSLLVLWLLRRANAQADLRFGVLQYPFMAHAWVETPDGPVNDTAESLKLYRPFPVLHWDSH